MPVHRAFARWCREGAWSIADVRKAVLEGVVLFVGLCGVAFVGVAIASFAGYLPPQLESLPIFLQAVVVASLLPAFHLVRYLLLSQSLLESQLK